jgi:protease IV
MFLAAFVALIVFCGFLFLFISVAISGLMADDVAAVPAKSVLYIDLGKNFLDKKRVNPLLEFTGNTDDEIPSLYELTRMIRHAAKDSAIKGIYLKASSNANSYASSEEIRSALLDFKKSGKWIVAYGDNMGQQGYHVANAATRIYCNPKGMFDWTGFSLEYIFFKNALDRLEIKPQIFYDGKFKSATEPFRAEKMTEENRLQSSIWLGDVYARFLFNSASARGLDSGSLRRYADEYTIQDPEDAVKLKLLDGVRYDDQVKDEMKKQLKLETNDKISFVTPGSYLQNINLIEYGKNKIAVLYAEGEIIDGKGEEGQVGGETYRNLVRVLRYDDDVKAIVLRVNSPGGSSLASEIIWRELKLAKDAGKPVVVSMGDVAASGGYYISCMADSIFALPNTITGSIGVFALIPNMQDFFKNKLGVTFDGVKTSTYADAITITRPMTEPEKKIMQHQVDQIYADFKGRVAEGRKKDPVYIDSIAQGRVWTGQRASTIGLVDKLGSLDDAIRSAGKLAKLKDYVVREYPEPRSPLKELFGSYSTITQSSMEKELGKENYSIFKRLKQLKESAGVIQARLPFEFTWR